MLATGRAMVLVSRHERNPADPLNVPGYRTNAPPRIAATETEAARRTGRAAG